MKLYMAAPYAGRDIVARLTRAYFYPRGHTTTSGWLAATRAITPATLGTAPASTDAEVTHHARLDLSEVEEADVLVHWTGQSIADRAEWGRAEALEKNLHSGGRHVETGFALALGKPVIVLGEPENIFQRGLCHTVPTIRAALNLLDTLSEDWTTVQEFTPNTERTDA